jgi:hypothetical protein
LFHFVVAEPVNNLREFPLFLAQFRIFWIGLELLIDLPQPSYELRQVGTQPFLRRLLFLVNRTIESDVSCLDVDNDVVRVRNWLWHCGATAGARSEDSAQILLMGTSKNIPLWWDDRRSSSQ